MIYTDHYASVGASVLILAQGYRVRFKIPTNDLQRMIADDFSTTMCSSLIVERMNTNKTECWKKFRPRLLAKIWPSLQMLLVRPRTFQHRFLINESRWQLIVGKSYCWFRKEKRKKRRQWWIEKDVKIDKEPLNGGKKKEEKILGDVEPK